MGEKQLRIDLEEILREFLEEGNYNEFLESTWAIPECAINGIIESILLKSKEVNLKWKR